MNVDYEDEITILLEDGEDKYLLNEKISLKPGESVSIDLSKEVPQGTYVNLPGGFNDKMTGLQFNLPSGVIVVFFEHPGFRGRQLVVFGTGSIDHARHNGFNDCATGWAWFKP